MPSDFSEEKFWNISQSKHIIGHDKHVEFPINTKVSNLVMYHLMNIHTKFDSIWTLWLLRRELRHERITDDDGIALANTRHLNCNLYLIIYIFFYIKKNLWKRWAKYIISISYEHPQKLMVIVGDDNSIIIYSPIHLPYTYFAYPLTLLLAYHISWSYTYFSYSLSINLALFNVGPMLIFPICWSYTFVLISPIRWSYCNNWFVPT